MPLPSPRFSFFPFSSPLRCRGHHFTSPKDRAIPEQALWRISFPEDVLPKQNFSSAQGVCLKCLALFNNPSTTHTHAPGCFICRTYRLLLLFPNTYNFILSYTSETFLVQHSDPEKTAVFTWAPSHASLQFSNSQMLNYTYWK